MLFFGRNFLRGQICGSASLPVAPSQMELLSVIHPPRPCGSEALDPFARLLIWLKPLCSQLLIGRHLRVLGLKR